jgi:hypothetical protein
MEADANTVKLTRLEKKSNGSVQDKPEYNAKTQSRKSNKQIRKNVARVPSRSERYEIQQIRGSPLKSLGARCFGPFGAAVYRAWVVAGLLPERDRLAHGSRQCTTIPSLTSVRPSPGHYPRLVDAVLVSIATAIGLQVTVFLLRVCTDSTQDGPAGRPVPFGFPGCCTS